MKRILYICCTLLTGIVLWSCENDFGDTMDGNGPKGTIDISLCADGTFDISADAEEGTKASEDIVMTYIPQPGDFDIVISRLDKEKNIYTGKYSELTDPIIRTDIGRYSFTASFGEEDTYGFVDGNCSNTHFLYTEEFDLDPQETKVVQAKAQMTKILMHVYFDAASMSSLTSYEASIQALDGTKETVFSKDETKDACYPPGQYRLIFYATKDGVTKTYKADKIIDQPNGRSFVKINIAMERADDAKFSATINRNDEMETVDLEPFILDWDYGPTAEPVVTQTGDKGYSGVVKATPSLSGMKTDLKAEGRIGSCMLTFTSAYLKSQLGGLSTVDLATTDQATIDKLATLGIKVTPQQPLKTLTSASIDFSGLAANCGDDKASNNEYKDELTLTLTDMKEKKAATTATYSFDVALVNATLDANDYNAFAKSIRGISATVTDGDISKYKLQYKLSSASTWTDVTSSNESGTMTASKISGLTPVTGYDIRLIHTYGSTETLLASKSLTTEEAKQLPNSGFEDWTPETYLNKKYSVQWYKPTNGFWAVNSKKSMPNSVGVYTSDKQKNYRCFPCVAYSTDKTEGTKSAHIYNINIGKTNTYLGKVGTNYAGELFIGSADDSGNPTYGKTFESRPDKFIFKYKYEPDDNETFYFEIEFKDSNGNSLFKKTENISASGWNTKEVPISFDISKKTSIIIIKFKSSSDSKPATSQQTKLEIAGSDVEAHFGSSLRIDDLELIYE